MFNNFNATCWKFRLNTTDPIGISIQEDTTDEQKDNVANQLEHIFRELLHRVLQDGALPTDLCHIYVDCTGMDFRFAFNPAGEHAVTIGDLLKKDNLNNLLEIFAHNIQSGTDCYIDEKSVFIIYTYRRPEGGWPKHPLLT